MTERQRRYRAGRWAERLCAWYLRLRGYRILARRFRAPVGEIDLVVTRGNVVAFVEVKARRDHAIAVASITPRQRRRIRQAAALFVGSRPRLANLDQRFDVMLVAPWSLPAHVIDAWRD